MSPMRRVSCPRHRMATAHRLSRSVGVAGLIALSGLVLAAEKGQAPQPRPASADPGHREVITRYCVSCHNEQLKRGGLSLDPALRRDVAQDPAVWERVVRKVRARQMPPIGLPRPDEATYQAIVASLETSLDRAAQAAPNPGRTASLRRLTRIEYQNAIRDLLALDVDAASMLPADESSFGFDNAADGDLSPTLLDRYVSAAETISKAALGRPTRSPGGETIRTPPDL